MNKPVNIVLSMPKRGLEVDTVQLLIYSLDMNLAVTVEGQKMIRRFTYLAVCKSLFHFTQKGD